MMMSSPQVATPAAFQIPPAPPPSQPQSSSRSRSEGGPQSQSYTVVHIDEYEDQRLMDSLQGGKFRELNLAYCDKDNQYFRVFETEDGVKFIYAESPNAPPGVPVPMILEPISVSVPDAGRAGKSVPAPLPFNYNVKDDHLPPQQDQQPQLNAGSRSSTNHNHNYASDRTDLNFPNYDVNNNPPQQCPMTNNNVSINPNPGPSPYQFLQSPSRVPQHVNNPFSYPSVPKAGSPSHKTYHNNFNPLGQGSPLFQMQSPSQPNNNACSPNGSIKIVGMRKFLLDAIQEEMTRSSGSGSGVSPLTQDKENQDKEVNSFTTRQYKEVYSRHRLNVNVNKGIALTDGEEDEVEVPNGQVNYIVNSALSYLNSESESNGLMGQFELKLEQSKSVIKSRTRTIKKKVNSDNINNNVEDGSNPYKNCPVNSIQINANPIQLTSNNMLSKSESQKEEIEQLAKFLNTTTAQKPATATVKKAISTLDSSSQCTPSVFSLELNPENKNHSGESSQDTTLEEEKAEDQGKGQVQGHGGQIGHEQKQMTSIAVQSPRKILKVPKTVENEVEIPGGTSITKTCLRTQKIVAKSTTAEESLAMDKADIQIAHDILNNNNPDKIPKNLKSVSIAEPCADRREEVVEKKSPGAEGQKVKGDEEMKKKDDEDRTIEQVVTTCPLNRSESLASDEFYSTYLDKSAAGITPGNGLLDGQEEIHPDIIEALKRYQERYGDPSFAFPYPRSFALRANKDLTKLVLQRVADDSLLEVIGKTATNLKYLDVSGSPEVTNEGIQHLLIKNSKENSSLYLMSSWVHKNLSMMNKVVETLEYLDYSYTKATFYSRRLVNLLPGSYVFQRIFRLGENDAFGHHIFHRRLPDLAMSSRGPEKNSDFEIQLRLAVGTRGASHFTKFLEHHAWRNLYVAIRDTDKCRKIPIKFKLPISGIMTASKEDKRIYGEVSFESGALVALYSLFPVDINAVGEFCPTLQTLSAILYNTWKRKGFFLPALTKVDAIAEPATILSIFQNCPSLKYLRVRIKDGTLCDQDLIRVLKSSLSTKNLKEIWLVPGFFKPSPAQLPKTNYPCPSPTRKHSDVLARKEIRGSSTGGCPIPFSGLTCTPAGGVITGPMGGSSFSSYGMGSTASGYVTSCGAVNGMGNRRPSTISEGSLVDGIELTREGLTLTPLTETSCTCKLSINAAKALFSSCPDLVRLGNLAWWAEVTKEDYEKFSEEMTKGDTYGIFIEWGSILMPDLDLSSGWDG